MTDIEIAQNAKLLSIEIIAEKLGISADFFESYGKTKAKISLDFYQSQSGNKPGKLVLVTAINPTPAGEGKTTTSVGLADALNRLGKKTTVCLREPSLGPCFGMKGGAAGGGYAQVVPMEDINLHFTGDLHAITSAHNLLAAVLDNHLHQGNALKIDTRKIVWNRVVDLNDRALRNIVLGLGGSADSIPREGHFDITVASEVMAILCLSESLVQLKERLGKIIVAYSTEGKPITAADLKCNGAMTALLKDALKPNLVQTLEGNPAFIHGGPFANIAHGCNSVIATKLAMRLSEYTVTEAGFGAELGAQKFLDIKCRKAGIHPNVVVIVATIRALKNHGGVAKDGWDKPNGDALRAGVENLQKHIENMRKYGLPAVVAINAFTSDTPEEIAVVREMCAKLNTPVAPAEHWAKGGAGAEELAKLVIETAEKSSGSSFKLLYPDEIPLWEKVETICREIYGANGISAEKKIRDKFAQLEEMGFGNLPICIAKTQYSLSADPNKKGRPQGFEVPIRDVKVSAGAGFVVVLTGDIMTMPGLPKIPAAEKIDIDDKGNITGLF
ncbi:MAG: formate--tetrahydrofolate ligase [Planctomycetaceae bacterium]|nr:formate--tetrahydrofolate ligase [Planctomycetaceae bacterium]